MLKRIALKIIAFLLKSNDLSVEDRSLLTYLVLDNLHALPIRDIISFNEDGSVIVNGKTLVSEQITLLRESARAALNNTALKLIHDQVEFTAVTIGIHKSNKVENLLFGQSAIWYGQQEKNLLTVLANYPDANEMEQELSL